MNSKVRMILGVCLLLVAVGREAWVRLPAAPTVVVSTRSQQATELKSLMSKVDRADKKTLAEIYAALADAVTRGKVKSTEELMNGTANALDIAFDGRKLLAGVDLGAKIDATVAAAMGGMPSVEITDANSAAIVRGLTDVAWACGY